MKFAAFGRACPHVACEALKRGKMKLRIEGIVKADTLRDLGRFADQGRVDITDTGTKGAGRTLRSFESRLGSGFSCKSVPRKIFSIREPCPRCRGLGMLLRLASRPEGYVLPACSLGRARHFLLLSSMTCSSKSACCPPSRMNCLGETSSGNM